MSKKFLARLFQVLLLSFTGLFLAIGFLVGQARATSTIFYIDALTGSDTTGNGSAASPYQSIQKAHDESTDGVAEIFYVRAGATYSSFVVTKGGAGPEQADIYTVWPGTGSYPKIFGNVPNLVAINADYVTLDGLEVDGSAGSNTADLIMSDPNIGASYITIRNVKVHDSATDEGIQLKNAPYTWIENVESYNNIGDGINLCCGSYSSTVRLNYAHDNTGADAHGGFYFYDEVGKPAMTGLVVEHNVAISNVEAGIKLEVDGALIHNNLISGTLFDGTRGAGIYLNEAAILNIVSNNTIFNSATDGVLIEDAAGLNNTVQANIIVSSTNYAIRSASSTQTVDYNLYWQSGISQTLNVAPGPNSLVTDPLFVSGPGLAGDFYLSQIAAGQTSNSPALDGGSQTAVAAGLSLLTTRPDEQNDQNTVDLGYHYPALPYTLTVTANPVSIIANGVSTTTLTAALLNNIGNLVPDGTTVVFNSTLGNLENQMFVYTAKTSAGSTQAVLTSVPANSTVTSTITANVYGSTTQTQVSFTAQSCGASLIDWIEYSANPVFGQGVYNGPRAYYPTVSYSPAKFDDHGDSAYYKMWFGASGNRTGYAISDDGLNWITQTISLANINGYHAQVVYDAGGFGGSGVYYKIWYWDPNLIYDIAAIRTADSVDGQLWINNQPLTHNVTMPLVTGVASTGWQRGTYGPISLFYQAGASNTGPHPFDYSYVMYYDATDGGSEVTGLAYSADGVMWTRYGYGPVLGKGAGGAWDNDDAAYGSIVKDEAGTFHFWYSGGSGPVHEGIGYAVSTDGINWTKNVDNPIFHISDGVSWRDVRTYTPAVLYSASRFDGHGSPEQYKMWFTGDDGINRAIGYAAVNPVHLALKSGSGQSGLPNSPLPQPFVAELRDSCNNPVSGITVTFTISDTPGGAAGQSLSVVSGATNVSGQISTTLTLGDVVGQYPVVAASSGVISLPTTYSATAVIYPVDHFVFNPVDNQVVSAPFTITITARDSFSNVVTTYTGSANLVDSTGTLSPTVTPNFVNGVATVTVVINVAANDVVITATNDLTTGVSNAFNVAAGSPPIDTDIYLPIILKNWSR